MFRHMVQAQLERLADLAEVVSFTMGEVIKDQGSKDRFMYILLHGSCAVDRSGHGRVKEISTFGSFFGERSFTGYASRANASIRASSVVTVLLRLNGALLDDELCKKCLEHLDALSGSQGKKLYADMVSIGKIEAFGGCSESFREMICSAAVYRSYMPGQLLCEEGAQDDGQTFVLCFGRLATERGGRRIAELGVGASFGELLMLGLTQRRKVSIRAETLCLTVEISRAAFQVVCARHPDEFTFDNLYRKLAEMHRDSKTLGSHWTVADAMPIGFNYSLNVACERRVLEEDTVLTAETLGSRAVHVIHGLAEIRQNGTPQFLLEGGNPRGGALFNQEVLLGIQNESGEALVCKSKCEVQLLHTNSFSYACTAFWDHQEVARNNVVKTLLPRLQLRHQASGGADGGSAIMRLCPWFRVATNSCGAQAFEYLQVTVYQPGAVILAEGTEGDAAYWLLHGSAAVEPHSSLVGEREVLPVPVVAPAVFGTMHLLRIQTNNPLTIRATSMSLVGTLKRSDFICAIKMVAQNPRISKNICKRVQEKVQLKEFVAQSKAFAGAPGAFLERLLRGAEHLLFGPGETVVTKGEPCELGVTPCFLMLGGCAEVEVATGVFVPCLHPGDLFGEAGSLGLVPARGQTVRSRKGQDRGFLHIIKFSGIAVLAACRAHPSVCDRLVELFTQRDEANRRDTAERAAAMCKELAPLFAEVSLFKPFPMALINNMVCNMTMSMHAPDACIFEVGDFADSMVLVATGAVALQTKHGVPVGTFGVGASFGEAALLGLLPVRPATLKATSATRVAEINAELLEAMFKDPAFAPAARAVDFLREERREQVSLGLPMCLLPLHVSPTDVCVRMAALTAARLVIPPKAVWMPMPESSPDGPWFSILAKGRVRVEILQSKRHVTRLSAGAFVPEGLVAGFEAAMMGEVQSEAYRMRLSDLVVAASSLMADNRQWCGSKAPMQEWYDRCRLLEKDSTTKLRARFEVAQGADTGFTPNSSVSSSWATASVGSSAVLAGFGLEQRSASGPLRLQRPAQGRGARRAQAPWVCPSSTAPLSVAEEEEECVHGGTGGSEVASRGGSRPGTGASRWLRPGSRAVSLRSGSVQGLRGSSSLPMLASSRPCSSGSQTKAFYDEASGCGPGDLLAWTMPPPSEKPRPAAATVGLRGRFFPKRCAGKSGGAPR